MRITVQLKSGESAVVVGYAPGRKGQVLAVVVIGNQLRAVKLRNLRTFDPRLAAFRDVLVAKELPN